MTEHAWIDALQRRVRTELTVLLVAFALGLTVVPVGIFYTGQLTLGSYRDAAGLGVFLADYFAGLARGHTGTWLLALGPVLLLLLGRCLAWIWRRRPQVERG